MPMPVVVPMVVVPVMPVPVAVSVAMIVGMAMAVTGLLGLGVILEGVLVSLLVAGQELLPFAGQIARRETFRFARKSG